jgi:hypothetical protein
MIRLRTEKISSSVNADLEVYNSINRIPFKVDFERHVEMPETIFLRNQYGQNFIEFGFRRDTLNLYTISLIAFDRQSIFATDETTEFTFESEYAVYLDEVGSNDISTPMIIKRNKNSIAIDWNQGVIQQRNFNVGNSCLIGITNAGLLKSVTISVTAADMVAIFGF